MPRREFLLALAATGAAGVLAAALGPAQRAFAGRPRGAASPTEAFPDGVIAGDPLADGSVIWVRVAPPDDRAPVPVAWMVAEEAILVTLTSLAGIISVSVSVLLLLAGVGSAPLVPSSAIVAVLTT